MNAIVIDGLNEDDFRRSIENRLREGRPEAAIERLRRLLVPYAGPERILPERFLAVEAADLKLQGWNGLEGALHERDRPGQPVTALSIAFGRQAEDQPEPDVEASARPHIETSYFTDEAFPFSQCGRDDLLEGYSIYGCNWAGDAEATDTALSLEGIDDLYGALAELEASLLASAEPEEDSIRAGSLASCLLSALLFQAVKEQIGRDGLPRPICVMAGSNDVYPYFDAPVAGIPEDVRQIAEVQAEDVRQIVETQAEGEAGQAPVPRYSSLLITGIPRARKRLALVLEDIEEEPHDIAMSPEHGPADSDGQGQGEIIPTQFDAPDGLLLRKKPGKARDLLDIPGPGEPAAPFPQPEPVKSAPLSEVAHPQCDQEMSAGSGHAAFDPSPRQRSEGTILAGASPGAEQMDAPPTSWIRRVLSKLAKAPAGMTLLFRR